MSADKSPGGSGVSHLQSGFNTGVLDMLSIMFSSQAILHQIEPALFVDLIDKQCAIATNQGIADNWHPAFLEGRQIPLRSLSDVLKNLTLADLQRQIRGAKFQVIDGGKEGAKTEGDSSGTEGDKPRQD